MNPFYQSYQKIRNDSKSELPRTGPELVNFLLRNRITPEQKVRQMLMSGTMTPEQYEALSQKATDILKQFGRK